MQNFGVKSDEKDNLFKHGNVGLYLEVVDMLSAPGPDVDCEKPFMQPMCTKIRMGRSVVEVNLCVECVRDSKGVY